MPQNTSTRSSKQVDRREWALEQIRPRLGAFQQGSHASTSGVDVELAATRMSALGQWAAEPAQRARFTSLPLTEFNHTNLDLLEPAAASVIYLAERLRTQGGDKVREELAGAWTLLVDVYEETRAAACFLFRHEPERLEQFRPAHELGREN